MLAEYDTATADFIGKHQQALQTELGASLYSQISKAVIRYDYEAALQALNSKE